MTRQTSSAPSSAHCNRESLFYPQITTWTPNLESIIRYVLNLDKEPIPRIESVSVLLSQNAHHVLLPKPSFSILRCQQLSAVDDTDWHSSQVQGARKRRLEKADPSWENHGFSRAIERNFIPDGASAIIGSIGIGSSSQSVLPQKGSFMP
ncbi:hypothetical protein RRG08_024632 [Elysia crispata]|uniref:Uncharacterized protein n=1 Tax=Elysia crispata TaxID=231223 RepID=A0AAE0ZWA0_9GAST|nr:hypothetical protein RRG08_024632 [Elysia crispata]